jgi:hypothetical protein
MRREDESHPGHTGMRGYDLPAVVKLLQVHGAVSLNLLLGTWESGRPPGKGECEIGFQQLDLNAFGLDEPFNLRRKERSRQDDQRFQRGIRLDPNSAWALQQSRIGLLGKERSRQGDQRLQRGNSLRPQIRSNLLQPWDHLPKPRKT